MSRLINTIMSIVVILFLLIFVFTAYSSLTFDGELNPTSATEKGKGLLSDAKDATSNAIGKVKDKTTSAANQVKEGAKKVTKKAKDTVPKISKSKGEVTTKKDNTKVVNPNSTSTNIKEAKRVAAAAKDIPESFEDKKPTRLNPKPKDAKEIATEKLVAGKDKVTSVAKDAKKSIASGANAVKEKTGTVAKSAKESVVTKKDELTAKGNTATEELTAKGETASSGSDDENKYLVIAGSYSSKANANSELKRLKRLGVDAEVAKFINSKYHTVCVGRYPTRKEATTYANELKKKHKINAYLHKKR